MAFVRVHVDWRKSGHVTLGQLHGLSMNALVSIVSAFTHFLEIILIKRSTTEF